MLFERENHQMAPLEDSQVAPSEVQAPNKESLTEANTSTGGPTATTGGNESWIAVAETDALRRAEADAEASFMVQTSHHSTQASGSENNNVVHHHHHHHHHHYHHHHHSLSLGSSQSKEDHKQVPPPTQNHPPIEHPSPPNHFSPPINKTPLRALINSALVENSGRKFPRKLARSNTTLDAHLTSSKPALAGGNSSQPGSPQIRALKSVRAQSQEENHPPSNNSNSPNNSTGPSTPTNKDKVNMSSSRTKNRNYADPNLIRTDKTFDMEQMNRSLDVIKRTGSKKANHIDQNAGQNAEIQNGSSTQPNPPSTNAPPAKSAKYKKLWGKVGKHGMMKAAEAAGTNDSSGGSSGSSAASGGKKKASGWDQLLNPVLQKQRAREANYHFHVQQVQLGEAVAGSGWTGANMECDCGEDSCPRCNLLLSMDDPTAQW